MECSGEIDLRVLGLRPAGSFGRSAWVSRIAIPMFSVNDGTSAAARLGSLLSSTIFGTPQQEMQSETRRIGSDSFVDATYRFRLLGTGVDVSPVLRVSGSVLPREYILLFDLPEDPELALDDPSLVWSDSLQALYRYAPECGAAGILKTPPLVISGSPRTLRIRVHRWSPEPPSVVEEIALTAMMDRRPAIIFAEGE